MANNLKEEDIPDELGDDALDNALLADQAAELRAAKAAAEVNPALVAALVATTGEDMPDDFDMADAVTPCLAESGALDPNLVSDVLEQPNLLSN